ncbi:MAG TPA: hypothetical protein VFS30_03805 [Dehalococcoidia bacterium]|nr:hypothetical protein [Dehalococcoidia bacterium]
MGKEQLEALARIIEEQLKDGPDSAVIGTWTIRYDGARGVLYFEKCEDGFYCEERPAVIDLKGNVVDRGGPILVEEN